MTTKSITRDQLSDRARQVVDLVERFGFDEWRFDYSYPTPTLENLKRVQVRDVKHLNPASKVQELKAVLQRGGFEEVPPIVMTSDGATVDGNTRIAAALAARLPTMHAIILDAPYDEGNESEQRRLVALGAAFNARNGKGIDRIELGNAVKRLASDPNFTGTRIAALLGVTESAVLGYMAEKRARDRAESLGLHVNGSLKADKLKVLGRQSEHLNTEPFKALFSLADDTGMSGREIRDIAKKAIEAKSDEGALEILTKEREARKDQIADFKASGKSVPPTAGKLKQRLGFILAYKDKPTELVEHNPTLVESYIDELEQAVIVLQKTIQAHKGG